MSQQNELSTPARAAASARFCQGCDTEVPPWAVECPGCGFAFVEGFPHRQLTCPHCRTENHESLARCRVCRISLADPHLPAVAS